MAGRGARSRSKVKEQGSKLQGAGMQGKGRGQGCPSLRTCSVGSSQACDGKMARWRDGKMALANNLHIMCALCRQFQMRWPHLLPNSEKRN